MKKLKKLMLAILTLTLAISISVSGLTFTGFATFEADIAELNLGSAIPKKVEYGKNIEITVADLGGADITIIAPSGKKFANVSGEGVTVLAPESGKYVLQADELGYYTVKLAKDIIHYGDFKIHSQIEQDLTIRLPYNGAEIATRIQKSAGTVLVPRADAVYTDDEGEVQVVTPSYIDRTVTGPKTDGDNATTNITLSEHEKFNDATSEFYGYKTFTPTKAGTYTVRYTLTYGPNMHWQTDHTVFKDFTVIVQDSFNDVNAPEIQMSTPAKTANINTKVTLPKATATDDFDDNLKISVRVLDAKTGEHVSKAIVDERTGYAIDVETDNGAEVPETFDNADKMYFYPRNPGTYRVLYRAMDDSGKLSEERSHTIEVSDNLAPVIVTEASEFPYEWASTKITNIDDGDSASRRMKISYPYVYDNSDEIQSVEFTIAKDSVNHIRFTDIWDTDGTGAGREAYPTSNAEGASKNTKFTFDETGFDFLPNEVLGTTTGDYTFTFKATDKAGKNSSVSYTVKYSSTLTDTDAPTVTMGNYPAFLTVTTDKADAASFNIPSPSIYDAKSQDRVYSEHILNLVKDNGGVDEIERFTLKDVNNKTVSTLKLYNGFELIKEGESAATAVQFTDYYRMYFSVIAIDNVGNEATEDDGSEIRGSEIRILRDNAPAPFIANAGSVEMGDAALTLNNEITAPVSVTIKPDTADLINFSDSLGIEVLFYSMNGDLLNYNFSYTRTVVQDPDAVDGSSNSTYKNITIDGFKFAPSVTGDQVMVVRVFDLAGTTYLASFSFTVEKKSGNIVVPKSSAPTIPANGTVGESFSLVSYFVKAEDGTDNTGTEAITVNGPRGELMGHQFTPKAVGYYSFSYSYTDKSGVPESSGDTNTDTIKISHGSGYSLLLLGQLPVHVELDDVVTLPLAVPNAAAGNVDITYTVTDNSGTDVPLSTDSDGRKFFTATVDGKYTILISGGSSNIELKVSAGDNDPPAFRVVTDPRNLNSGDTFKFSILELTKTEIKTEMDNLKVEKTLYGPDKSVVASVSGTSTTGLELPDNTNGDGHKLNTAGTYTITYKITDKAGNSSEITKTFTVVAESTTNWSSMKAFSTVLIIAGALLIVGVVVYLIRFRRIKE